MKKILLLDGNTRSALAVTRSLGSLGYNIEVGETGDETSLSSSSRYASRYFKYPSPDKNPTAFLELILEKLKTNFYDILIATTDHTLQVLYQKESV